MQALQGIKVADFSKWLPGQYCGMLLGDYGAEVIKVEDLNGDGTRKFFPEKIKGMSYWHLMMNRNKRGFAVDIKKPGGRDALLRLLKDSDIFLEGFRPGYLSGYGLDYEAVRKVNPKIIYCSITGFGQESHKPAHDLNVVGLTGLNFLDDTGAACVPTVQVSALGSSLHALSAIMMALLFREKTGEGQYLDVSLYSSALSMQVTEASGFWGCMETGTKGFGRAAHYYNIYRTRDGRYLTIGTIEPKFWEKMCTLLELKDLIPRQFDFANTDEIKKKIAEKVGEKTLTEWLDLIGNEEFCVTPVCTIKEALESSLTDKAGLKAEEKSDLGMIKYLKAPVKFSRMECKISRRAPKLGEHTLEILSELGYSGEEIEKLRDQGAI